MSSTARFTIAILTASITATEIRADDCAVSVTGPNQPWTVSRSLHWRPAAASPAHQCFSQSPPGRGAAVFSVMSAAGPLLQFRLFSDGLGGYLITLSPSSWDVRRTFVGTGKIIMASSSSPEGRTPGWSPVSTDAWASYQLTVHGAEQLELERLWDNGTSSSILRLSDTEPIPVQRISMRVMEGEEGEQRPPRRGVEMWSFWKFDCASYFRQREPLCHVWPSWHSVVPRHFDLPSVRINPSTSISVHVRTSGTADLLLYETPERYYLISLTRKALTLSKRVFASSREVARTCLSLPVETGRFRLVWVSMLVGVVQVGLDELPDVNRTCGEDTTTISSVNTTISAQEEPVTNGEKGSLPGHNPALRNTFLSWRDPEAFFILFYGFRTRQAQGRWTVDCEPQSAGAAGNDSGRRTAKGPPRNRLRTLRVNSGGLGNRAGLAPPPLPPRQRPTSSPRYLTALIVLSVISVLLLLLAAILASDIVSRRRRRTARLDHDRRLSLAGEQQLSMAMGNEYSEVLYDDLRPMNLHPGESTFKPIRRQDTPRMTRRSPSPPFLPPPPEGI